MDTERGNMEILFQKIPYYCISENHDYKTVNRQLYLQYAKDVFSFNSEDEIRNKYIYLEQMVKKGNVFSTILDFAKKVLVYDGNEIKCKIDEMLRWREISFQLGQDLFTCAFLADNDVESGFASEYFAWVPIIRSDDMRLHNILKKGIADNHFHLNGSTKIFELNWICLMNIIENRRHDFKKIPDTLQMRRMDIIGIRQQNVTLYEESQEAAFYRIALFAHIKKDGYLMERTKKIYSWITKGMDIKAMLSDIQDIITLAKHIYGAVVDEKHILDYAFEKNMYLKNNNDCRLLSGERKLLYECFKAVITGQFDDTISNIFYRYISIRTQFRGELIQVNRQVGFANFSNYEVRKEAFIEGIHMYEKELVRLAVNEPLSKDYMVSLEARICPSETPSKLYKKIDTSISFVDKNYHDKLIYVLHFPKKEDADFQDSRPRHYKLRNSVRVKSESIAKLLMSGTNVNKYIRGIDACANEINCRPEVFAQSFRYLSDIMFESEYVNNNRSQKIMTKLHTTYHVGEDFLDIVDGIRAVDEALLFCGLGRGSRIGHGLALGVDPYTYYCYKGKTLAMEKQRVLDNIVWLLCRADEFGIHVDKSLRTELEGTFYELYKELYYHVIGHDISMLEYYQSWKLRGDKPELYLLFSDDIEQTVKINDNAAVKYERYGFNHQIKDIDNLRKIDDIRKIYHAYHFDKKVRECGNEITIQKVDRRYADVVKQLQDSMIHQLVMNGIGIETNPSSNYLIGTIMKYDEHPILRFNSRKLGSPEKDMSLSVSVNTDDQGVFDTLLENEYALMTLALKKAKDEHGQYRYDIEDIYEWIDYVRSMGIEQTFR